MSLAGRRQKLLRVDRVLRETYGEPEPHEVLDPVSELVLTILSQHTSDRNSTRAFAQLRDRFGDDWDRVADARSVQVVAAIRTAGLANIKAPRIQAVLREVRARRGRMDLDFLADLPVSEAMAWLQGLPGVGPKTAACVLLFSLGMPAFPVDTHVHRVTRRLGLIDERMSAEDAHRELARLVPKERTYAVHVNLVRHGRQVCRAPLPLCDLCALARDCEYYLRGTGGARSRRG
ncbi:MAG: endonuclease III [Myxococcota bacterium]